MRPPEWPTDHGTARRLLERYLPGAPLDPLGEGDSCLAYRQGSRVVRMARHPEAAEGLRREACILPRIADRLPLPVPRPVLHEPAGCAPFSVHEEVRGEALTRELWLGLPEEARERTAEELARFLAALHALPTSAAEGCALERLAPAAQASRLRHDAERMLLPLLGRAGWSRLGSALDGWTRLPPEPEVLLHRDVAPGHLLYDPVAGHLSGVIDFGDLALGDRARDFIYLYEDFGPELLGAVLSSYPLEGAVSLRPRILSSYLLETVDWTLERHRARDEGGLGEGLAEIGRVLRELEG